MKLIGRILIILAVFALVMGITYVIVNGRSSSTSATLPGNEGFSRSNGAPPAFPEGGRPGFPGGRNEFRGERGGGGGWLFETLKNVAIIGIIVVLIVIPKSWIQKRKRAAAQVAAG